MKTIIAVLFLVAFQAIDLSNPMPMTDCETLPMIRPKFTGTLWQQIQKIQGNRGSRIVGGQIAYHGQFPWQAHVILDDTWVCGGSVITREWILTTAHCANGKIITITLGAQNINQSSEIGRLTFSTSEKIIHELFDNVLKNNIALLKLPNPVQFNEYINAMQLPSYSMQTNDFARYNATASGWGVPSNNATGMSSELRFVTMTVMPNIQCPFSDDCLICTDPKEGKGTCVGDLGGPLVVNMDDGGYIGIGISSFLSCEGGPPSGFTRITSYLQWIEDNTGIVIDH